jgi:hypothetical protein
MSANMPTAARFKNRRSVTLMLGIETDLWSAAIPKSIGLLHAMRNHHRFVKLDRFNSINSGTAGASLLSSNAMPEMTGLRCLRTDRLNK